MESDSTQIGSALRRSRLARGLTLRQVARAAGVCDTTVLRLERNEIARPSADVLSRVSQVLEVSRDAISSSGTSEGDDLARALRTRYASLDDATVVRIVDLLDRLLLRDYSWAGR